MDYTVHGILQAWILEWAAFTFSRGSSQFRDRTQSSTLQVDSIPAEPQGKPKNTGVGSISFLQLIFLTRGINPGSLALQANSLPVELSGKPNGHLRCRVNGLAPRPPVSLLHCASNSTVFAASSRVSSSPDLASDTVSHRTCILACQKLVFSQRCRWGGTLVKRGPGLSVP